MDKLDVRVSRAFTADLVVERTGDGLTVEGVVVPYEQPGQVCDEHGPTPIYDEVWTAASFAGQLGGIAARPYLLRSIPFTLEHRDELERQIGHTVALRSADAGLAGAWRLNEGHKDIGQVRSMLAESHTGLSMVARLRGSRTRPGGAVERLSAILEAVAAVPVPTFAGAGITAIRAAEADWTAPTPKLDAVAAAWGFDAAS